MKQTANSKVERGRSSRLAGKLLAIAVLLVGGAVPCGAQGSARGAMVAPLVDRAIPAPAANRLRSGFETAVRQVREVPKCRALFESLGADPQSLFPRSDFRPATSAFEDSLCRRGAAALTKVGQPVTWVCRGFAMVKSNEAAILVIHETLHFAGLRERPSTPDAMSSHEINSLVASRCGL